MLTVYAIPVSLYCAKLRIVLRHKGLEWEEIAPPGGYGSAEYKSLVPAGNLPALRHGQVLIADSEAIGEYLNDVFPDPPMLPGDAADRARARMRSRFHDTRLEPALRKVFGHIGPNPDSTMTGLMSQEIRQRLDELAMLLKVAPPGPVLTLGDCGMPITGAWIDALTLTMRLPVELPGAVRDYFSSLEHHPAVAAELASYRPRLHQWLAGKIAG